MTIFVDAGDYQSASPKLERAADFFHAHPDNDGAFQRLVITLVDEACRGVSLYTPVDPNRDRPVVFRFNNANVFALYTDCELAKACASIASVLPQTLPQSCSVSLAEMIDLNGGTSALALNMGLPAQIILPPNVVHTIRHLMNSHRYHTKEPEGSSWNEWIGIMERYFAEAESEPEDLPREDAAHREAVVLHIPVHVHSENGSLPVYHLEP